MADRETPIQVAIVKWLRLQYPKSVIHHCRNEIPMSGQQAARQQAYAKHKGAVTGFPDLVCFFDGGRVCLFEVKAEGNYATESQREVHDELRSLGFNIAVVRSIDDTREYLGKWGMV